MLDLNQRLSPHFRLGEFLHAGILSLPPEILSNLQSLAEALESARSQLSNRSIIITSGYRSLARNLAVGGATKSYHLRGLAADIVVPGISARDVQRLLKDWPGGMGLAESFTHLDIRSSRTRFYYG